TCARLCCEHTAVQPLYVEHTQRLTVELLRLCRVVHGETRVERRVLQHLTPPRARSSCHRHPCRPPRSAMSDIPGVTRGNPCVVLGSSETGRDLDEMAG